jgi:hypothetical protein
MTTSNLRQTLALGASALALTVSGINFPAHAQRAEPQKVSEKAAGDKIGGKAPGKAMAKPAPTPIGPLIAVVSINNQRITVYNKNGRLTGASVSSGQSGHETPQGIFSVIGKEKEHFSNLYNDAPMPNMQRITWSGVALHAGNLPGYPASHGCIRLPYDFSARLYNLTKMGTRVIVARNDVVPVAFSHPRLFTPKLMDGVDLAKSTAPLGNTKEGETFEPSNLPMMLGASSVALSERLGEKVDAATAAAATAEKPVGMTLTAMAVAAGKAARESEKAALAAKTAAAIRNRDSERATSEVLMLEKARSAAAAKLTMIEASIASAKSAEAQQKLEDAKTAAEARLATLLAETDAVRLVALDREFEAFEADDAAKTAAAIRIVATAAARDAARKLQPVSVFVSRKTNRLYVRQGFEAVFDVPVTIASPEQSIGTHVYTVMANSEDGTTVKWNAVTVLGGATESARPRKGQAEPMRAASQTAAGALERIDMPKEAVDRISELLTPGSSLIISDKGISNETGKGTDFVILTR